MRKAQKLLEETKINTTEKRIKLKDRITPTVYGSLHVVVTNLADPTLG